MGNGDSDRSANVAPFKTPDEEPVHEGVQWCCNE